MIIQLPEAISNIACTWSDERGSSSLLVQVGASIS
jgi:hypothetical protein